MKPTQALQEESGASHLLSPPTATSTSVFTKLVCISGLSCVPTRLGLLESGPGIVINMFLDLSARLQQYVNRELPDVQAGFRKGRGTRDQIANICWIIEKAREFQKNTYFFIDDGKAFDCVDHNKLWKILKWMGIPATWYASWEICMQVRKQQLELDMEQQTGSK